MTSNTLNGSVRRRQWRRIASVVSWVATVVALAGFAASVAAALPAGTLPRAAVILSPSSGDSGTVFSMATTGSGEVEQCPGDGVAGFRWAGFLTPASNDPATLRYNGPNGTPNATLAPGSLPLQTSTGSFIVGNTPGAGTGFVQFPEQVQFDSTVYSAANLTPGDFWIGLACYSLLDGTNTAKFWSTKITITALAGAGPNGFTYALSAPPTTTPTTPTTPTTTPATTPTTTPATTPTTATATTVAGTTTTTTTTTTPTTTTVPGASGGTVTPVAAAPSAPTGGGPSGTSTGTLPSTGSSTTAIVVWGILLVVFGRMAILFGRKPKVIFASP